MYSHGLPRRKPRDTGTSTRMFYAASGGALNPEAIKVGQYSA